MRFTSSRPSADPPPVRSQRTEGELALVQSIADGVGREPAPMDVNMVNQTTFNQEWSDEEWGQWMKNTVVEFVDGET